MMPTNHNNNQHVPYGCSSGIYTLVVACILEVIFLRITGAKEIVQDLRVLTSLPDDSDSIPNTRMVNQPPVTPILGDPTST